MNLSDYLNQETPVKMPFVVLEWQDVEIFDLPYEGAKRIRIKGLCDFEYLIKKDTDSVYVMDAHGNVTARSCFHLSEEFIELWVERWKDVAGFEGVYQISSHGNLRSLDRYVKGKLDSDRFIKGEMQRPEVTRKGYLRFTLSISKKVSVRKLSHVLVGEHFIDKIEGKTQINHKDGIKANNFYKNLEWSTGIENVRHAWDTGLTKASFGNKGRTGILASASIKVEAFNREGLSVGVFDSLDLASKATGIHKGMIGKFLRGKIKKMRSGFIFKKL